MIPKKPSSQTKFWRHSAGTALIATALAGCGGGSGGGAGTPTMLSGAVIDGYISGATVCLDLNADQTCGPDEPKATSGEKGAYSLDITGIKPDVLKAAHLFTDVPKTAKDSDDIDKTLEAADKAPFSMLAPMAAYVNADNTLRSAVISPLTTLVSHDMLVNDKPFQGAQNAVRSRLGLSDTVDLSQDFVATKATDLGRSLHQQAQVIAAALGQAQKAIAAPGTTSRDAFFAAMAYTQEKAKDLKDALSGDESVAKQVAKKMEAQSFSPNPAFLLSEARQSTQSTPVTSVTQLLKDGVYLADLLQENPPQLTKVYVLDGLFQDKTLELKSNDWKVLTEDNSEEFKLVNGKWVEHDFCSGASIKDTTVGIAELTCPDQSKATVSVRSMDIQDKSLADLGQNAPNNLTSFKFPNGAKIHQTVLTNLADFYHIWTGSNIDEKTIASFMNRYPTGNGPNPPIQRFYSDDAKINFTFDTAEPEAKSGKVSLWVCQSTAAKCTTSGKADYEIKTVQGQELLIVKIKPVYEAHGNFLLFAAKDGRVHSGIFRPAVTGSMTDFFLNKTAMNAVLKAANLRTID